MSTTSNKLAIQALALAILVAVPAHAARVKQVRVGDHPKFTRIVVELDGPAGYGVERDAAGGDGELRVLLEAGASGRVVTSRSRLVERVAIQPAASGAVARVHLREPHVAVREMVLKNPYRIVLDVSRAAPASTPVPSQVVEPPPELQAAARPPAVADEPAPAVAQAPGGGTDPAVAQAPGGATDPAVAQAPGADPAEGAGSAEPPSLQVAGADPADPADPPVTGESAVEPLDPREPAFAPRSAREPETETTPVASSGDPGLGLTSALMGIAALLLAFLLLRRRSQRIAREAAAAPWPPPGAEERPEYTALATAGPGDGEEAPHVPGEPETVLASSEDDAAPGEPTAPLGDADPDPIPAGLPISPLQADSPLSPLKADLAAGPPVSPLKSESAGPAGSRLEAEPEVVAKEDARVIDELERRIERLEVRLSDALDSRERLERQLASHTEELRVQRAAIARTQRALRAAVRGGPEAAAEEASLAGGPPSPSGGPTG